METIGKEPCIHPDQLAEQDRFALHQDLENDLPAFILALPAAEQTDWLIRWRNPQDPCSIHEHPWMATASSKTLKWVQVRFWAR